MLVSRSFLIGKLTEVLFPITVALLEQSNLRKGASSIMRTVVDSLAGFQFTVLNR
jgi:hypothetical protein